MVINAVPHTEGTQEGAPYAQQVGAPVNNAPQVDEAEVAKAKSVLSKLSSWLGDDTEKGFRATCEQQEKRTGIPAKVIARNFLDKTLGTIGDVLGIAIGTVRNVAVTIVDIIGAVLKGAVNTICKLADSLARIITLNKTCQC